MTTARPRATRIEAATLGMVAIAATLLVSRLWLPALGQSGRVAALAVVMLGILVASLLVPVPPDRARVRPAVALTLGLGALGLAVLASGRPVPAPFGAWALPLALLAAVAEEALFRRAAYGALQRRGAVVAIGATAVLFAAIHVPLYGVAALPVDLGAGLLLSWQRWASGTWTVPAATHAAANLAMTVMR